MRFVEAVDGLINTGNRYYIRRDPYDEGNYRELTIYKDHLTVSRWFDDSYELEEQFPTVYDMRAEDWEPYDPDTQGDIRDVLYDVYGLMRRKDGYWFWGEDRKLTKDTPIEGTRNRWSPIVRNGNRLYVQWMKGIWLDYPMIFDVTDNPDGTMTIRGNFFERFGHPECGIIEIRDCDLEQCLNDLYDFLLEGEHDDRTLHPTLHRAR